MATVSPHNFLVSSLLHKLSINHTNVFVNYNNKKKQSNIKRFADILKFLYFTDLITDKEELHNVLHKFPDVHANLEKLLRSIVDYPEVSKRVHLYNKKEFVSWRHSLGRNYSQVIAHLRWNMDWQKDPFANEKAVDKWIQTL